MLRRVGLRRTGISAKGRTPISRGSAPQGVSAKRKSQRVELVALRLHVLERDRYQCRYCRVRGVVLEVHHIVKRSQWVGGLLQALNCVTLCQKCHRWTDSAYASKEGRLVIERCGELVIFSVVHGANKFAVRMAELASPFLNGSTNQACGYPVDSL